MICHSTRLFLLAIATAVFAADGAAIAGPVGSGFTYQGRLHHNGQPVTGNYDFSFRLYGSSAGIIAIGDQIEVDNVFVDEGTFKITLDFSSSSFSGDERWLSIGVRPGNQNGSYTALSPRQELTPVPHAMRAQNINLPLLQGGQTNPSMFFNNALIELSQTGASDAIKGGTSGSGAGVRGTTTGAGAGVAGNATGTAGEAGHFEIQNAANAHSAVYGLTNGTGSGVFAQSISSGPALRAHNTGSGPAGLFKMMNTFAPNAAIIAENESLGPAVRAKNTVGGPALEIEAGTIKVTGAGLNTGTPAFVHRTTSGNISSYETVIDHPMCNGDEAAILIVTPRQGFPGTPGISAVSPVGVYYYNSRWRIYKLDLEEMHADTMFNILVIKP